MQAADENSVTIVVRDLTKVFGRFVAVDRVSFAVRKGELFGFLGPNGAGKSTTIRMLCGLLTPSSGTAIVGGFDVSRHPEQVRETIGYMSQKFSLYKDLTVFENIRFFGGVYGLKGSCLQQRTEAVIAMAGLRGLETKLTGTLSGAFQQRLALGCAVLHEPRILFLDEATSGVDPISRRSFWRLIQDMAGQGVTVLVTTHFMDEAEFCGRIALISGGRLIAMGSPSSLKRDAMGEDLFEVRLASFRGAKERIDRIAGVAASSYFGPRMHVSCRRGACGRDGLENAMRDAGLDVQSVREVQPSLEDAFVRLVQRQTEGRA